MAENIEQPHITPYDVARAAVTFLGDQWRALPGEVATTGRLRDADRVHFTIGTDTAGRLYVRNEELGDSAVLPFGDLAAVGRAVADVIGDLY